MCIPLKYSGSRLQPQMCIIKWDRQEHAIVNLYVVIQEKRKRVLGYKMDMPANEHQIRFLLNSSNGLIQQIMQYYGKLFYIFQVSCLDIGKEEKIILKNILKHLRKGFEHISLHKFRIIIRHGLQLVITRVGKYGISESSTTFVSRFLFLESFKNVHF